MHAVWPPPLSFWLRRARSTEETKKSLSDNNYQAAPLHEFFFTADARLRAALAASEARAEVAESELAQARAVVSKSEAMNKHLKLEIAKLLFEATTKWLGNLRGGLAISTTLGAAAFGAASGSSVGTATVFTKLALPQMLDRGYDKSLASASIAIAGTLAVMIPPSALVVVYGILTDSSIGALLIAGFIPGIVFAIVLCVAIWLTVLRNPALAPRESYTFTLREKLGSLKLAGPLVLIILLIVAGLYLGVFTPTEAGGIGAFATFLLAIIRHRGIKGVEMRKTLLETIQTSAMIFGILICALVFSKFLALSGVANAVGGYLTGLEVNRWVIVLLVSLTYLALGMMMDAPALLAITLPITHPVMMNLGFDPIWFGIFVVLLVEIGAVTPPVGINCFVVQAASNGRVSLEQVFKGLLPFVLAGFAMLVLLCLFPKLALFLPETML